jgi:hypothetical protein
VRALDRGANDDQRSAHIYPGGDPDRLCASRRHPAGSLARDNRDVSRWVLSFALPFSLLAVQPHLPSVKLAPEAAAAFDRYAEQAETRIGRAAVRNTELRGGELRIEAVDAARDAKARGGMIRDWVGTMFVPGATLAQVQAVFRDYANYKKFYQPKVIESKQLAQSGDEYDVFLRLHEEHILTVILNTTYHIRYSAPDAQHLIVTSRSTRIAEVKDPDKSYDEERPVGHDTGFLWRLNSYWRFQSADGGVYARCEAISLSRDVPRGLGWMLNGFLESLPKESMLNSLEGTRDAVKNRMQ